KRLEGTDVPALPADDPALHVIGRQLDQRDGGLGRVARGDALQGIRDEVARASLRLVSRFLLELTDLAGEVVADQLLGASPELVLRLVDREVRDALELRELTLLEAVQAVLQRSCGAFAGREVLLAVGKVLELPVDLLFLRVRPLFGLNRPRAALLHLALDVSAEADGLLPRLALGFSPHRFPPLPRLP